MSTALRAAVCKKLGLSATAPQSDIYRAAIRRLGQQWGSYEEARNANPGKKIIKVRGGYGSGQSSLYEVAPETDWLAEKVKAALESGKSEEDVMKEFQISRPYLRQIRK